MYPKFPLLHRFGRLRNTDVKIFESADGILAVSEKITAFERADRKCGVGMNKFAAQPVVSGNAARYVNRNDVCTVLVRPVYHPYRIKRVSACSRTEAGSENAVDNQITAAYVGVG